MINVTIGTNLNRTKTMVTPNTTIRTLLEEYDIDYSVGGIHLDGMSISGSELDKTFADFGITEKCTLISVVKSDGGSN